MGKILCEKIAHYKNFYRGCVRVIFFDQNENKVPAVVAQILEC